MIYFFYNCYYFFRMSLCRIHLKKLFGQAANQGLRCCERHLGFFGPWFSVKSPQPWTPVACVRTGALVAGIRLLCTAGNESQVHPIRRKNPDTKREIGNVIQVISENGEDLGTMTKTNVIKIMEERNLKLVVQQKNANPPVYKLMTGKQLFEEQMKQREKEKQSSKVEISELIFRAGIGKHDLDVKKKQLSQWIEKKRHVRVTILNSRSKTGPQKEDALRDLLQYIENEATCSSNPKEGKGGQTMTCVLRPLSKKELQMLGKDSQKQKEKPVTEQETNPTQSSSTELPNP